MAEWQTRQLQVLVSERAWGFKSPLAHQNDGRNPLPSRGFLRVWPRCERSPDTADPGIVRLKLAPGEERASSISASPVRRSAVINLTITQTEIAGYVAVFPADVAWPGNSSINWSETNQNVANGVITKVDATGKIKIRGGDGSTHVIIDRIGYMI